ncbi:MAG TPA: phosphatidate cytidylyltransferase [Flavobacteriales bacterium]|nr:phosphatidate cytidylyltransferase [Flavobacteriales bacterium]
MDKNLVQRALAGLVFLAIMITCICFSVYSSVTLFLLLGMLSAWEFTGLINQKKQLGSGRFLILGLQAFLAVLAGVAFFTMLSGQLHVLIAATAVFITTVILFVLKNEIEMRLALVATNVFSIIYALFPFLALAVLSFVSWTGGANFIVLYFFVLIWTNDTMAYCCGRLFGKTKLAETISPKKTVEGFVGGIIFTTLVSFLILKVWDLPIGNPIVYYVAPAIVGVFGTAGDLLESALKRWVGVKDSGNIIPGHGGLLDRFDGAIFAIWPYIITLTLLNR